ncbi:MAG: hypothetical protein ACOCVV_11275 [Marinobacter sp.]
MIRGLILVLVLLLSAGAHSESLGKGQAERFLASMQELQDDDAFVEGFLEAHEVNADRLQHPGSLLVSESVSLLAGRDVYGTLERVAEAHGFSGVEAWAETGDRILLAVISLQLGDLAPAMARELERVADDIKENDQFSEAQKARMLKMLRASSQMINRARDVDEADQQAVRPYLEKLKDVFAYKL